MMRRARHQGIEASRHQGSAATSLASSHRPRGGARGRAREGFTLIELVVAVGIIVVLVGLLVATVAALTRSSETRQTEDLLTLLDRALDEWQKNAERSISYGKDGEPFPASIYDFPGPDNPAFTFEFDFDTNANSDDHETTDETVEIVHRDSQARTILATINPKFLKPGSPAPGAHEHTQVIDSWDTEIVTLFPGRTWVDFFDGPLGTDPDPDGTIRTEFEDALGICPSKQIIFVSAGPDGKFGDLRAADGSDLRKWAEDNLYSQPVEAP